MTNAPIQTQEQPKSTQLVNANTLRKQEQWQAAEIATLLPKVSTTLLEQVDKELQLVGTLNTSYADAQVASGKEQFEAASVTMSTAIASAPLSVGSTLVAGHFASRDSVEMKQLKVKRDQLSKELKENSPKIRVGTRGVQRDRDVVKNELEGVKMRHDELLDENKLYTQIPGSVGQTSAQMVNASGGAASASDQLAAKAQDADATIDQSLASQIDRMYGQAVQMIETLRNVNPYDSQAAAVRG